MGAEKTFGFVWTRQGRQSYSRSEGTVDYSDLDWTWSIDGSAYPDSGNCDLIDTDNLNSAWNSLVAVPKGWEDSHGATIEETKYLHSNAGLVAVGAASAGKYICNNFDSRHAALHKDSMDTSEVEWEATQSFCSDDEEEEMLSEHNFNYRTGPRWVKCTRQVAGKGILQVSPHVLPSEKIPMIDDDLGTARADSYPTNAFGSVDLPVIQLVSSLGKPEQKSGKVEHSTPLHICKDCSLAHTSTPVTLKSSLFSSSEDLTSRNRDSFMIERPDLNTKKSKSGWVRLKRGLQSKFSPSCIASNLASIVSNGKLGSNRKWTSKALHRSQGEASSMKSVKGYCRRQQYLVHRIEESIK